MNSPRGNGNPNMSLQYQQNQSQSSAPELNLQLSNPSTPQPQQSMLQGQLQNRLNPTQSSPSGQTSGQQQQASQQHNQPQQPNQPQPQQPQQQQSPALLCRFGSDMLQDFLTRTTEMFQTLRACSPHLMTTKIRQEEQRARLRELVKALRIELVRIRTIYNRVRSLSMAEDEFTNMFDTIVQFEVEKPLPWDSPSKFEEYNSIDNMNIHESRWFSMKPGPQISEESRAENPKIAALEQQYQELYELNAIRNRQLKEVIQQMRALVWSTNDMLAMRRP